MTMGLVHAARQIEAQGRNGDKNLVHMSDSEIGALDHMQGGPSFNPVTGLREYSFLSKLLPVALGLGFSFIPGLGTVIGSGIGSAIGRGLQQAAEGKKFNLGQIVKSGLIGAGGAYAGQGLTGGGWSPTSGFDKAKLAANFTSAVPGAAAPVAEAATNAAVSAPVAGGVGATTPVVDGAGAGFSTGAIPRVATPVGGFAATAPPTVSVSPGFMNGLQTPSYAVPVSGFAEAAPAAVPKDVGFFKELAANVKPIAPQLGSAAALTSFDKEPEGPYVPISETPFDPTIRATDYLYGVGRRGAYNPQTGTFMPPRSPRNPTDVYNEQMTYAADGGRVGMGLPQSAAMPQLMSPAQFGYLNSRTGGRIAGPGDGKSDDIPALLSNGEHVIDAATVSDLGNGDNDTGQKRLEQIKHKIRSSAGRKNPRKASPKQRGLGSLLNSARA